MAVGASYFRGNPICLPDSYPTFLLESFSSAGGDPILFDSAGNALAQPVIRQKPQIVSPDGVNTTFFGQQIGERDSDVPGCANGPTAWNFYGTSAAAPHAAGVGALMMQAFPQAKPDDIYQAMEYSSILPMISYDPATYNPIEVTSLNFDTGYGFMQAPYALQQMLIANAGRAQVVPQGNTITLDASASLIPAGATPTYVWTQLSGPKVKLANANSANPSFQAQDTKTYAFALTIELASGQSSTSDPVSVQVVGGPGPGGGGGAIGLGLLIPGFMAAALRRRRKA